jgi:hypothetical protein
MIYLVIYFSNLCCSLKSFTRRFNQVLVIDHVYGGINLLKCFYILTTSPTTHCKTIFIKENVLLQQLV